MYGLPFTGPGPNYAMDPIDGLDLGTSGSDDPELDAVEAELYRLDRTGDTVATVIRDTFDQLYDGQHTGRYSFEELHKTEKTHMGTLIEINLHRAFDFEDGDATDYRIAGVEVDCKYSMTPGKWMLPPEVMGQLALLITADDQTSSWRSGLIRVREEVLASARNRDAKGWLSSAGLERIRWLWPHHPGLAPNLFLTLDPPALSKIFGARAAKSHQHGQSRTDELFRTVQRRIIRRAELATVARQDDFMKRARRSGGSRSRLQREGILVLGHQDNDPAVAEALGLPRPHKGEFVSARVVPAVHGLDRQIAMIGGQGWRLAGPRDPVVPAPPMSRRAAEGDDDPQLTVV